MSTENKQHSIRELKKKKKKSKKKKRNKKCACKKCGKEGKKVYSTMSSKSRSSTRPCRRRRRTSNLACCSTRRIARGAYAARPARADAQTTAFQVHTMLLSGCSAQGFRHTAPHLARHCYQGDLHGGDSSYPFRSSPFYCSREVPMTPPRENLPKFVDFRRLSN